MTLSPIENRSEQSFPEALVQAFLETRRRTLLLCDPLETEDFVVQPIEDVSPPKWHLGHTTWFFEANILSPFEENYRPFHPAFHELFNSYYESLGRRTPRPLRGTLSRPTVKEILEYRKAVEERVVALLQSAPAGRDTIRKLLETGIQHEQQHQELLLSDIKYIFFHNPLKPTYGKEWESFFPASRRESPSFVKFSGGRVFIGAGAEGFSYDNERPVHSFWLSDYQLGSNLVTNGQFLEFIKDGGYQDPLLWLSDGWDLVKAAGWKAPLYWIGMDGGYQEFSLAGLNPLNLTAPVSHVSFFEADAFARWAGKRLPTEEEWENAIRVEGESGSLFGMFQEVWQWTGSSYRPYPGFRAEAGALQEYNGKFMNNQFVCRGSSALTSPGHSRATYRNFFQPEKRWQRTGFRLADGG